MKAMLYPMAVLAFVRCCGWEPQPGGSTFNLAIHPAIIQETIPGQQCMLLVEVVENDAADGGPVSLSATAPGATVTVEPESISAGEVAEVTVIPATAQVNEELTVTIAGSRDGQEQSAETTLRVSEGDIEEFQDNIGPQAEVYRDRFIAWLESNRPELGITAEVNWESVVVTPYILVVTHHLFLSEQWEMHVYWHVMIPPYDWAKIDLRRRFTEAEYSLGFEISSVSDESEEPHEIEPSEDVWR